MEMTDNGVRRRTMVRGAVMLLQAVCIVIATAAVVYVCTGDFDTPTWGAVAVWWLTKLAGMAVVYGCCKSYSALRRMTERYED